MLVRVDSMPLLQLVLFGCLGNDPYLDVALYVFINLNNGMVLPFALAFFISPYSPRLG